MLQQKKPTRKILFCLLISHNALIVVGLCWQLGGITHLFLMHNLGVIAISLQSTYTCPEAFAH